MPHPRLGVGGVGRGRGPPRHRRPPRPPDVPQARALLCQGLPLGSPLASCILGGLSLIPQWNLPLLVMEAFVGVLAILSLVTGKEVAMRDVAPASSGTSGQRTARASKLPSLRLSRLPGSLSASSSTASPTPSPRRPGPTPRTSCSPTGSSSRARACSPRRTAPRWWVKDQHPALDIRFVFSNAKAKLRKGSPTTYADVGRQAGLPVGAQG
jgi:hypothetical protein